MVKTEIVPVQLTSLPHVGQNSEQQSFDVVIAGAGAAGLMCAIEAGKRGRRVALLEHAERVGKKILISGGGRCNFTNLHCRPENFLSANPHFARSALARYTPADFISLVEKHGIAYHEKTLGQLFCDGSAEQINAMLLSECASGSVKIFLRTKIREVRSGERRTSPGKAANTFVVSTGDNGVFCARVGCSYRRIVYSENGRYRLWLRGGRQFGVPVRECRPALVPLVLGGGSVENYCELAGISAGVGISR